MKTYQKILSSLMIGALAFSLNYKEAKANSCSASDVASTESNCYQDLKTAINNLNTKGGTLDLLKTTTINEFLDINTDKNITINLNNYNIEGTGNATILLTKGDLKITGYGKIINRKLTSINGTLCIYGSSTDVEKNSTLTIDTNVTIEGINPINIILNAANESVNFGTTVDIYGTILNNAKTASTVSAALSTHGNIKNAAHAPIINIHDGAKLISNVEDGTGIYQAGNSNITINKATIEGQTGIITKSGTLNLKGTTVTATGPKNEPKPLNNGFEGTGAAIQVESNKGYYGKVNISIDGGTYTSSNNATILEYVDSTDDTPQTTVEKMEIKDGEFNSPTGINNINVSEQFKATSFGSQFITGGTFSSKVDSFIDSASLGQSVSGQVGKLHNITVEQPENGKITVNENAVEGEEVTITATPDEGYKLESITVTKTGASPIAMAISNINTIADDNTIEVKDGKFTMPNDDVKITATFVKEEAEKVKVTVLIKDEEKEYEVEKGSTLQNLLDNLKKEGLNIKGFTNKDNQELDLTNTINDNMYLIAIIEDEKTDDNPKTLDNIIPFISLGIVGTIVCGIASKKYLH